MVTACTFAIACDFFTRTRGRFGLGTFWPGDVLTGKRRVDFSQVDTRVDSCGKKVDRNPNMK